MLVNATDALEEFTDIIGSLELSKWHNNFFFRTNLIAYNAVLKHYPNKLTSATILSVSVRKIINHFSISNRLRANFNVLSVCMFWSFMLWFMLNINQIV